MNPTPCANASCSKPAIGIERRQSPAMSAPGFYGYCADHAPPKTGDAVTWNGRRAVVTGVGRHGRHVTIRVEPPEGDPLRSVWRTRHVHRADIALADGTNAALDTTPGDGVA